MRYLVGNYAGAHRDIESTAATLRKHSVPENLVGHYKRVMTVRCPHIFNATITHENALKYWRAGNNLSINRKLEHVIKTMNKEHKHKFVVALPS